MRQKTINNKEKTNYECSIEGFYVIQFMIKAKTELPHLKMNSISRKPCVTFYKEMNNLKIQKEKKAFSQTTLLWHTPLITALKRQRHP